ncbi:class I SAM-dependent methyltransferase [Pseudonocardia sp. WMMC193]|uniref:class I SAM-dependent methyltransferase n=1 Tax=Pseudonocardia sp. WMMC193 TaxID=2911965 RepID=UPI001F1C976E|nr:class I SAM-dependent methyltransferase [Pseudonocardia sp. WMMC193]MCF7551920.1 class I SAM-dependent methyltransferase [Pseudonocardia sp. WMMC193]
MWTAESNRDQLAGWDGPGGAFWADNADRFDAGIAAYQPALVAAAAPGPGDRVLDVGCGTGLLTRELARTAHCALGVDLSSRMLTLARQRAAAAGVPRARFAQADAQVEPFRPVDLVVSRNGVMFFGDPPAAFANLARALRPGGRMVLLFWQGYAEQEWMPTFRRLLGGDPMPGGPFSLGDPDHVRTVLRGAGFTEVHLESRREPMVVGPDVDAAVAYVAGMQRDLIAPLPPADRASALRALRTDLTAHAGPGGVAYGSACWLVRARV